MTFDKLNPQSLVTYVNQHQKPLHTLLVVLLSLYLIAFAAKFVWRIIPEPQLSATTQVSKASVVSTPSGQGGVNISKIQQLNLFGDAKAAPKIDTVATTRSSAPDVSEVCCFEWGFDCI